MELIKKNIHMNKLKCKTSLQITLDDDFNVSDIKPDIEKIIKEQGTIRISDVKMQNNKLIIKGSLLFNVLYLSDENGRPVHNIEGELPFEEVIHLEENCMGNEADITWDLEDLSASMINSRKLSVRAIVCLTVVIEELYDEATAVDLHGDSDINFIHKQITVTDIAADKKDTYRVKEQVSLSSNKGNVSQILYKEMELRNVEIRLMEDRFSMKGELVIFVLYESENEETPIEYYETEIPISAIIECSGCNESMIDNITITSLTGSIDVMPDSDGEERVFDIEAIIELGIKIYEEEELELLSDIYSPSQELVPVVKNAHYENLLVKNNSKIRISDRVRTTSGESEILQICHASGDVKIDDTEVSENGIEVSGVVEVQILYICSDDSRPFNSVKGIVPFSQTVEAKGIQPQNRYHLTPVLEQLSVMMLDSEEIEVKISIGMNAIVFESITEPIITDVVVHELDYEKLRAMPSIVGYVVKQNDSLWNIAKKYYTTVDKIIEVNELESDRVKVGDKLIIMKQPLVQPVRV